jgi:hypothetical protein
MIVIKLGIFFLQMAGVGQQNTAQIDRRRGGVDRALEPILDQARYPAAMVNVRMRKHNRIDCIRRNRSVLPVALAPFLRPLKHAAID